MVKLACMDTFMTRIQMHATFIIHVVRGGTFV